jgi:integrase
LSYGTGTVDRLPSGRYRVRLSDGSGHRITIGTYATPEEAERMRVAGLVGKDRLGVRLSLADYGEKWLSRTAAQRRNRRTDHSRWMVHVAGTELGAAALDTVTRADVRDWMRAALGRSGQRSTKGELTSTGKPVSRQTVVHALGLVRRALQEAVEDGHLEANPAAGLKVPSSGEHVDWAYLTAAELGRVLELELRPDQRAAFTMAAWTGLREGELAGLRWTDLDGLSSGPIRLHVRQSWGGPLKTRSSRRSLYLLPAAAAALRAWRELWLELPAARRRLGLVFPSPGGDGLAKGYDWQWAGKLDRRNQACWLGLRDRAGLRHVRWHDLRHTCASHLVMGTWTPRPWSLQEVRDYLGHSSIKVTERYAHLGPELQAAAIASAGHELVTAAVSAREHSASGRPSKPTVGGSNPPGRATSSFGNLGHESKTQEAGGRDQSVTSLAERVLRAAMDSREIAAGDVAELARAVIDQAPEAVRLALRLVELELSDPMRGPLGLQLAAAVLALRPAAGRGRLPHGR